MYGYEEDFTIVLDFVAHIGYWPLSPLWNAGKA